VSALNKALAAFDSALEQWGENTDALCLRGNAFRDSDVLDRAINDYSTALALDPRLIAALESRGACYKIVGQVEKALADFSTIIEMDPRNDFAYNMRAELRLGLRGGEGLRLRRAEFEAVEKDLKTALQCNEHNYHACCNLGRLYDEHAMYEAAIAQFSRALAINEGYTFALYRRGCTAVAMVEQALRGCSDAARADDPVAVAVAEAGRAAPSSAVVPKDAVRVPAPRDAPTSLFSQTLAIAAIAGPASGMSGIARASRAGAGKLRGAEALMPQHQLAAATATAAARQLQQADSSMPILLQRQQQKAATTAEAQKRDQLDKAVTRQIEAEQQADRDLGRWRAALTQAVADFSSSIAAELPETRGRVAPAYMYRAKCFALLGDADKAEADLRVVREELDAAARAIGSCHDGPSRVEETRKQELRLGGATPLAVLERTHALAAADVAATKRLKQGEGAAASPLTAAVSRALVLPKIFA
jgi:hypothetical protein